VFFLDDLHNLALASGDAALTIRDQFQAFGIEELNYSVCFSAKADYFSGTLSFAEPAVRFYNKLVLAPFTPEETFKYATAVFGSDPRKVQALSDWLYEKTVGHPYFLAFISRELWQREITLQTNSGPKYSFGWSVRNSRQTWLNSRRRTSHSCEPSPQQANTSSLPRHSPETFNTNISDA